MVNFLKSLIKNNILSLFGVIILLWFAVPVYAQKAKNEGAGKNNSFVQNSPKNNLDSLKKARQHFVDSLNARRKKTADSLFKIRQYKESKKYKDSVFKQRQAKSDSIRNQRTKVANEAKKVRMKSIDSLKAIRKKWMDSVSIVRNQKAKERIAITKYKESKRYRDSVAFVRQAKADSAQAARATIAAAVAERRKKTADSAKQLRLVAAELIKSERKKILDSVKADRKKYSDSLAKIKDAKERLLKSKEKQNEEKKVLAFQLKIKKQREAWSNEKMLKKNWGLHRQIIQNTFTRYNYFFNANKKMDEALGNMLRMRKENYDTTIALFPFDPDRDSTALSADMDSVISKSSVGIQIHDPRTKWGDNLYLLLGQAYYYKGKYESATTVFKYIISQSQQEKIKQLKEEAAKGKKVPKKDFSILTPDDKSFYSFIFHESSNNEAVLWLTRTFTEAHQEQDAYSLLELVESDKNKSESLQGRLALEKANLYISDGKSKLATDELTIVSKEKTLPVWLRQRAAYLNGQLLFQSGDYNNAADHFQQVIELKPKIDMDFYARRNKAYCLMQQGGQQQEAIASLKNMLTDGKYAAYNEQVYYVLGRLSANNNRDNDAIQYFQKSVSSAKTTKKQKAISFADLGNVYYKQKDYAKAKNAYDSAMSYSKAAPGDSLINVAASRVGVLDKVTVPMKVWNNQDSLLRLSLLSEKEQKNVVKKYIKYLEQYLADSIARSENDNSEKEPEDAAPDGASADWYFANSVNVTQGIAEFKKKWGSIPNVDNWRRSASINNSKTLVQNNFENEEVEEVITGVPTEEKLLSLIPNSEEKRQLAHQKIQKALIDLANAYVFDLKDYSAAIAVLDTLDKRYSQNDHMAEALFLRYRIALEKNQLDSAKKWSELLISKFPETSWAKDLKPKADNKPEVVIGKNVAQFYDETYDLMQQRKYDTAIKRAEEAQRQFRDAKFDRKFELIKCISIAGSGQFVLADSLLKSFIATNTKDSLKDWADAVLNYVQKQIKATALDTTKEKSLNPAQPQQPKAVESKPIETVKTPETKENIGVNIPFVFDTTKPHRCLIYISGKLDKVDNLKKTLAQLNQLMFGPLSLKIDDEKWTSVVDVLAIASFQKMNNLNAYLSELKASKTIFKDFKSTEYQIFKISETNWSILSQSKDIEAYKKFYKEKYK